MKNIDYNYKERIENFIFNNNWIEPPLYYNNMGKTLRFDLESKSEKESILLIKNIFNDIFFENSKMFIIFYGSKYVHWQKGKKYIKLFKFKKILKKNFVSKNDDYDIEDLNYVVVGMIRTKNFKFNHYIKDYLEDEQTCQIALISLKKGVALNLYDSRGFDVLSLDKNFLKMLFKKYEKDIIEYNKKEIVEFLNIE